MVAAALAATATAGGVALGHDEDARPLAADAQWTTVFKAPAGIGIEGLTADKRGALYVAGRGVTPCPVYKVGTGVVGTIPGPCGPAGCS